MAFKIPDYTCIGSRAALVVIDVCSGHNIRDSKVPQNKFAISIRLHFSDGAVKVIPSLDV